MNYDLFVERIEPKKWQASIPLLGLKVIAGTELAAFVGLANAMKRVKKEKLEALK